MQVTSRGFFQSRSNALNSALRQNLVHRFCKPDDLGKNSTFTSPTANLGPKSIHVAILMHHCSLISSIEAI
jgi:hypothetical protein